MKFRAISILTSLLIPLIVSNTVAQKNGTKPQFWNNATVAWEVNDNLLIGNTLSYNILFDNELPWSELTYNGVAVVRVNSFIQATGGLYIASTNQSKNLNSLELRPYIGLRFSTSVQKRWLVSNLSRLEWRNMIYSNDTNDVTFRFRNRTTGVVALNKQTLQEDHMLSLFSYFEVFHNFENDVVERYFTLFKYKVGLIYRVSPRWRIDLGTLFNQARSTIVEPSQPIANVVTNVIIEWGIIYSIQNN